MKILLVEDDHPTATALTEVLTSHHYTVDLAIDGQTALEMATAFEYDLIVLDVVLPKLNGIQVCQHLRSQGYQSPILLLTSKDSSSDRIIGLDAGADDYVVKPFDIGELLARIRALLRRGKSLASEIHWETLKVDLAINQVTCNDHPIHLTPKEYCLLELLLLNPKRIFSRSAILDRLWDFADSPGEETVSTHIKCLRQKLKAAGSADPIETVHGLGYRLKLPQQPQKAEDAAPPKKPKTAQNRSQVTDSIAKIWEKTKGTFISHVTVLEEAATTLAHAQLTPELQEQAKQAAHKLSGSLGIFGAIEGSQLAKQLEQRFQPQVPLDPTHAAEITELVQQLRRTVETNSATLSPESPPTHDSPLVLIIGNDLTLADRVRAATISAEHNAKGTPQKFRVEVATDLTIARKAISTKRNANGAAPASPDVIVLDLSSPDLDDRLALLKELMQQKPEIQVLAFTGQGRSDHQLELARLGEVLFQKLVPTDATHKASPSAAQ